MGVGQVWASRGLERMRKRRGERMGQVQGRHVCKERG